MRHDLSKLQSDHPLLTGDGGRLLAAADKLLNVDRVRLDRLWAYYRNPMRIEATFVADGVPQRPYRQAQEWGLPPRITGLVAGDHVFGGSLMPGVSRKEVVIENDIGWRIETQIDFLFGRPIVVNSASPDAARRPVLEQLLRQILANNGGLVFLQKLALLGAVYGQVDVLVKFCPEDAETMPAAACATQLVGAQSDAPAPARASHPGSADAGPAPDADAPPADADGYETDRTACASHPSPEALERLSRKIKYSLG